MNLDNSIQRLAAGAETIRSLVAGVTSEQARWRPAPDKWSILEVVNHLYDEERSDFRARLNHIVSATEGPWPPMDPQGWVTERRYNERDIVESLENFLGERSNSITWLRDLSGTDWKAAYVHPRFGPITAGDLLTSWIAHDLLHIRQLAKLHYLYLSVAFDGYNIVYAGDLT
jgi:hypothetical protein